MRKYRIKEYPLEQGALEIQYIEEFFGEFKRKKTASEIMARLQGREHLIVIAEAPLREDPSTLVPVSFKVAHEMNLHETEAKLKEHVAKLRDCISFEGRKILYSWIGATRRDWRGQGHFRALTERQEDWAMNRGFDEFVVKTKNRFYNMRGTLARLCFDVVQYERNGADNLESKIYLSKRLNPDQLRRQRSSHASLQERPA